MFKRKHSKFIVIALIVISLVSILFGVLSTKLAGYNYLRFTSTQLEIIPKEIEWENRTIIQEVKKINNILSIIQGSSYYSEAPIKCDKQNWDYQLLVRRNLAKDDLSWLICGDKDTSYLLPLLGEYKDEVFKVDKQLNLLLEDILSSNK